MSKGTAGLFHAKAQADRAVTIDFTQRKEAKEENKRAKPKYFIRHSMHKCLAVGYRAKGLRPYFLILLFSFA